MFGEDMNTETLEEMATEISSLKKENAKLRNVILEIQRHQGCIEFVDKILEENNVKIRLGI